MKKLTCIIAISLMAFCASAQKKENKVDSTKNQPAVQQPTNQTFYLLGPLANFQLLYLKLTSPGDVTPNQEKQLADWVNKNVAPLPTDSTKKK